MLNIPRKLKKREVMNGDYVHSFRKYIRIDYEGWEIAMCSEGYLDTYWEGPKPWFSYAKYHWNKNKRMYEFAYIIGEDDE